MNVGRTGATRQVNMYLYLVLSDCMSDHLAFIGLQPLIGKGREAQVEAVVSGCLCTSKQDNERVEFINLHSTYIQYSLIIPIAIYYSLSYITVHTLLASADTTCLTFSTYLLDKYQHQTKMFYLHTFRFCINHNLSGSA